MPRAKAKAAPDAKPLRKPGVRYNRKLGARICARLAEGETMAEILRSDGMPSYSAIYGWKKMHREFAEGVRAAREQGADHAADEALIVARGATAATASADRLRIGALQWRAAKAAPHLYGARAEAAAPKVEIVVRVKQFETVTREDGSVYLREIMTEDGQ